MSAEPDLERLETELDYRFSDRGRLREALTHPSVVGMGRRRTRTTTSNQRLEFLGDRVLGLVIADALCARFATFSEGELSKRHAALVKEESLAKVALTLQLGQYLRLSAGEIGTGGRGNEASLADACEAVIAAIYLDGGLEAARAFVMWHWLPLIDGVEQLPLDPKTALQEWAQHKKLPLPNYVAKSVTGPAHAPTFEVEVTVGALAPAVGSGGSRRTAEKAAAAAFIDANDILSDARVA
jgi:ribonuclease-3